MLRKHAINISIILILLLLTIAVYSPGLTKGFHFDDYPNIVDNKLLHVNTPTLSNFWQAAWSGNSSLFGRPLSYLSFSINTYFSGLDARMMKITNLGIHLLTGILLFLLARTLLSYLKENRQLNLNINFISTMACGAWLLHPINLTSVLYIVQRMTSLTTLFSVCALLCYAYFRTRQTKQKGLWFPLVLSTLVFAVLSFLSKENAVLLLFYISLIEIFIFRFSTYNTFDKKVLKSIFISTYVLAFTTISMFLIINTEWLMNGYDHRNFTLLERLLTEPRILAWYLKIIVAPNIAEMGLFLDDFNLSISLFQPATTFLSIIFLSLLLITGFLAQNKYTLVTFGIFWFFSGHLLESTVIPLELIFEHRNYLPSFGIIIALVFVIERLFNNIKLKTMVIVLSFIWLSLLTYTTYIRAEQWKDPLTLAITHVEYHPNSVRAHLSLGGVYAEFVKDSEGNINEDFFSKADHHFKKSAQLEPCCSGSLVGRLALYSLSNRALPRSDFNELVTSLKEKDLDVGVQNGLRGLTTCLIDGVCSLSTEDYMTVMYAPLTRRELSEPNSAHNRVYMPNLLIYLSEYYASVLKDYDTAIRLTKIVVEEQPDEVHYRFSLINLLAASGEYEQALKELEIADDIDKYGSYKENLKSWRNLIESSITNNPDS